MANLGVGWMVASMGAELEGQSETKKAASVNDSLILDVPDESGGRPSSLQSESDLANPNNRLPLTGEKGAGKPGDSAAGIVPVVQIENLNDVNLESEKRKAPAKVKEASGKIQEMSQDTLSAAALALAGKLTDKQAAEAILRSVPAGNKEQFENTYKQSTGKDLRAELKKSGLESSIALLEPREESRNAAWLNGRLEDIFLSPRGSIQRDLLEHSVRNSLRSMSDSEKDALNKELLKNGGKDLLQTLEASRLSDASKAVAKIVIETGSLLNSDDLSKIAELAISSRSTQDQKLLILKEAFAGDSEEARNARKQFMSDGGQEKLEKAFSSDELKQAQDYARLGKLHTATFIDMQSSKWANSDKGVDLALSLMTPLERKMFREGEKLARDKSEGKTSQDKESLEYYKRVHASLENAAGSYTSPSRWFESNRTKAVAAWDDLAKNGEQTLIGRLAKAGNDFFPDDASPLLGAVRNFSAKDFELMKDPVYRRQVYSLLGGQDGKESSTFTPNVASLVRHEVDKLFGKSETVEAAKAANHTSLKEASSGFNEFTAVKHRYGQSADAIVFDALRNGKASDFSKLSPQDLRQLRNRVGHLPASVKEEGKRMLADLKAGKDIKADPASELYMDAIKGSPKDKMLERLLGAKDLLPSTDKRITDAARAAFGDADYEKYARPVLEGKGISAENLRDLHFKDGWISQGRINHESYYSQLKLLSRDEREAVLSAREKSPQDKNASDYLDKVFKGMSKEEREIAFSVLSNPGREYTLSDRIRTHGIKGEVDQQRLVSEFSALSPMDKLDKINDYAAKYKSFLPTDLARGADETTRKAIELSMPLPAKDLERAVQDWARETGNGMYGHLASSEISLAQTQEQLKAALLDKLPAEKREAVQKEIDAAFQRYVNALRDNDQAKDQYAKDLAEKVMTAALTVATPGLGASMARLALAAGAAVAARVTVESAVKGEELQGKDYAMASLFGVVDAAGFARLQVLKGAFSQALDKSIGTKLSSAARDDLSSQVEKFVTKDKSGEEKLAAVLKEKGVDNPEAAAREILQDVEQKMAKEVAETSASGARQEGSDLATRLLQIVKDNPQYKDGVGEFTKNAGSKAIEELRAKGIITEAQEKHLKSRFAETLVRFADKPEERAALIAQMKESGAQFKFLRENIQQPELARNYLEMMNLSVGRPDLRIPLDRLREAKPEVINFYSKHLKDVSADFTAPPATALGGARYEYAAQRETLDKLRTTADPELKKWLFVPGMGGSTADRMGIDGVFVNIENGKLMPINFKAGERLLNGSDYAVFFPRPGGASEVTAKGQLYFNSAEAYTRAGRFSENYSSSDIESHLKSLLSNDAASLQARLFSDISSSGKLPFPPLNDAPSLSNPAELQAQMETLRQYSLLGDKESSFKFFGQRSFAAIKHIDGNELPGAHQTFAAERLRAYRAIDPGISQADAGRLQNIALSLKSNGITASDKQVVGAYQQFRRLGIVDPGPDDVQKMLQVAKNGSGVPIETAAAEAAKEGLLKRLGDHIGKLADSTNASEKELASWAAVLRSKDSVKLDGEMISLVIQDRAEASQLRALLESFYAKNGSPASAREDLVRRALEQFAI